MNREFLYIVLTIFLGVASIVLSFISIHSKKLSLAVIAVGVVSLFASILFLLMSAPDVAMTEAAIGSGLTTLIFFYVLNKIKKSDA
ncbi:MAG TPA: hypothetical protein DDX39_01210 [Bacteroidales bacterium]|nr:MAG: hypothetical protein A2W98_07420 [Bacteroidetes bacterium GWF2_33_38]HBF87230.1 hypothetical protein [Bacteroidales bacterium]